MEGKREEKMYFFVSVCFVLPLYMATIQLSHLMILRKLNCFSDSFFYFYSAQSLSLSLVLSLSLDSLLIHIDFRVFPFAHNGLCKYAIVL